MSFAGTQQKCTACDKTVYPMDQLTADGIIYHRACFRCKHCQCTLKLGNYASLDGVLYCKSHIDQRLKSPGSVGERFETGTQLKSLKKLQGSPSDKNLGRSASLRLFAGTQEKCGACSKTVYPLEKVSVDGLPYHKSCFKCAHGGCVISPTNYAALEGRVYCKHHYSQLFKEKGNYSQLVKAPSLKVGHKVDA